MNNYWIILYIPFFILLYSSVSLLIKIINEEISQRQANYETIYIFSFTIVLYIIIIIFYK